MTGFGDSDDWALSRMVELRQAGEPARFRIQWQDRGGRRSYRVEIRRADGTIERPMYPLPLGTTNAVEESTETELAAVQTEPTHLDIPSAWGVPGFRVEVKWLRSVLGTAGFDLVRHRVLEVATRPGKLEREEAEVRELARRLASLAPGPTLMAQAPACLYSESFCGDTSCPVHGAQLETVRVALEAQAYAQGTAVLERHLGELAPGSLRTFRDKLEWVGNHAAEIGDPDVQQLVARALDGDEDARTEALEFWRLWKGLDELKDVP